MPAALLPPDEIDRLAALRALEIMDTPPSDMFDSFVRVARRVFQVPIAAVSFVEADRQWFKAADGIEDRQTARKSSFCAHAILDPFNVLCVPDARWDPRFLDNDLVTGAPGIRFYAGAPIVGEGGRAVGALCVIDRKPRRPEPFELDLLQDLAIGVSAAVRLHGTMRRLERDARSDPLTGLGNRREFDRTLTRVAGDGVTLFLFDLDRFKGINDVFGHGGGDLALQEVARRLQAADEACWQAFRLGGDEFALVTPRIPTVADRVALAAKIHACLGETFLIDGQTVPLKTSIGIAALPDDAAGPVSLMSQADAALYEAKQCGRGVTRHVGPPPGGWQAGMAGLPPHHGLGRAPEASPARIGRIRLGEMLRRALVPAGAEPFTLVFQPVVSMDTGRTWSLEALVRWRLSANEELPPDELVLAAERLGLVSHLDRWVLNTACRAASGWPEPWPVSVNISAASFGLIDVVSAVREALCASGLPASRLVIEMTETALAEDPGQARQSVAGLRALGVGVALDDFGGGHGSLATLKQFPFTNIKVDRNLIAGLCEDKTQQHLIGLVGELGRSLGVPVVAVGIETEGEMQLIRQLGATLVQGHLLAKPCTEVARSVAQAETRVRSALHQGGELFRTPFLLVPSAIELQSLRSESRS